MGVLLDTCVYSRVFQGDTELLEVVREAQLVYLTPVVIGELRAGFLSGSRPAANEAALREFLEDTTTRVVPVTAATAACYSEIHRQLRKQGTPIPQNDMWIAASAMEHDLVLLTADKHFLQIPQIVCRHFQR